MPAIFFGMIVIFFWIFVETLLLSTIGTTPGKSLLKTRLRTDENQRPGLIPAFKRSIRVWFFGQAIGFPFIFIFTYFCAYFELAKNKKTTWDRSLHMTITHEAIPIYRGVIAALIILVPIAVYLEQSYVSHSIYS